MSQPDITQTYIHQRFQLVLDGWNELDPSSRIRAINELKALRRDFPLLQVVISTMATLDANQGRSSQLVQREVTSGKAWATALDDLHVAAVSGMFG